MSATWKTVRVFISSTFRDMQAERDHLVRFVFPRLREQLLPRRIHLVDVDLRWGVTSEQDALEVCREIINECRPRFLCMLGGRYGWMPPGKTRSITADEVHYGVLDRTLTDRGFAYFYFRDKAATAAMVETSAGEFREPQGSKNETKLTELKQAIVGAGLNPFTYPARWDNDSRRLADLKKFGDQVYNDLLASMKSDPEVRDRFVTEATAQLDEFAEENDAMEAFIEERSQRFVLGSREPVLSELLAHASATGGNGYVCLIGASGSGKSALLAHLARSLIARETPETHESKTAAEYSRSSASSAVEDVVLISHFVGASAGSTDVRRTLRRLCHELKKGSREITADIPDDFEKLRAAFPDFLRQACASKRVVILLDAVNQFDTTAYFSGLHWLPEELPDNARVVLSTLVGPVVGRVPSHGESATATSGDVAYNNLQRLKPREIELQPLTAGDGEAIIGQFLQRYHKRFSNDQRAALLAKADAGTPLYLLTALEELRTLGTYEEITERIADQPTTTIELFAWILERLENDNGFRDAAGRKVGKELVSRFAALLGASRYGLSQRELVDLLAPGDPQGNVAALLHLLRPYLMRRGELLDFYHGQFRAAVSKRCFPTPATLSGAHRHLADYFETIEFGTRYVNELPWQLKKAEEKDRLIRCLTEREIFLALYTVECEYDLLDYWHWLGTDSDPADAYRKAVHRFGKIRPMPSILCEFTHQVARFLAWMSLYPVAEELYRSALDLAETVCGLDSPITAAVRSNLAELLTATGRSSEAESLYRLALEVAQSHPDDQRVLGISLSNSAQLLHANGRPADAEPLIRRALAIHEACVGPDSQEAAVDRLNLAEVLRCLSRLEEAEGSCRRALDTFLARRGSTHPETARCQQTLALILHETGRRAEAERLYLQAMTTYEASGVTNSQIVVAVRNNLAWLLMENSRIESQQVNFIPACGSNQTQAVSQAAQRGGMTEPQFQWFDQRAQSAQRALREGLREEVVEIAREMLERARDTLDEEGLGMGAALQWIAMIYYFLGDYETARPMFQRAKILFLRILGASHPLHVACLLQLAANEAARGSVAGVSELLRERCRLQGIGISEGTGDRV